MLLSATRAFLKPRPLRTSLPLFSTIISRPCSSSTKPSSTWSTLNRIPTPACIPGEEPSPPPSTTNTVFPPEIEALYRGNQRFRDAIAASETPDVLRKLAAQGQRPPFLLLDCSDSRVGEQVIFSVEPGTLFTAGNVANQFHEHDLNCNAVLAYAVDALKVKHVIVMGHYGCGGVAAATLPGPSNSTNPPGDPVQEWITPIRRIYEQSERPEIVARREETKGQAVVVPPHLHDPAFRALVEENVKANVQRIARSHVVSKHYASITTAPESPPTDGAPGIFVHGWVYDIETGEVVDLGVTVAPPGRRVPPTPFAVRR